jgi:DNA-3-methyladenine glycosylase
MTYTRLGSDFFYADALDVAPALLGQTLVRQLEDGSQLRIVITEVEAYRGEDDLGCHASKGRTPRTEIMYQEGGKVYVYLIYGMYWLLNFVTGSKDHPQAVLIRGCEGLTGPGRIGKFLQLDRTFYGEDLTTSGRIWVEPAIHELSKKIVLAPRIGIDYAGEEWSQKPWRFSLK